MHQLKKIMSNFLLNLIFLFEKSNTEQATLGCTFLKCSILLLLTSTP